MLSSRASIAALVLCLYLHSTAWVSAQMQPLARFEGELLPIETCGKGQWEVLKGGKKVRTWDKNCQIRAGSSFAQGFVQVTGISADLDPLLKASSKERSKPDAIRFHYQATLISDRDMPDCYVLLTFVTQGSVGTRLVPMGKLMASIPKAVEIKLPTQVDSVGSLHVFTNSLEVRSTQHTEAYDVFAYFAELVKGNHSLSAAELLKSENIYRHALSADGRYLAALRIHGAKKVLIIYDLESMKLLCENPVTNADEFFDDPTWVSDHEVAYVAHDDNHDESLFLLDARTSQIKHLADKVSHIVESLPDEPETLIVSYAWWTYKFNTSKEKSSGFQEYEAGHYLFDRKGNDRVLTRYDKDNISYLCRPTPGARFREIDDTVKQPGLHFNIRRAKTLDRMVDIHAIGPDGDTLYLSTRLGSDRFELVAYSMSEGIIKRTIAKHPKYDLTTGDGGIARLLFAKNSPDLLGIVYGGQKPQVVWFDPKYAAVQKSMDATFPDHVNLPIDWSKDAKTFIFVSASEQDPGTFYVFKPLESRLIPLLELGERLKGKVLAKTEPIEFTARDGHKIPAYVTRPPFPGKGLAPLIVSIHGGPMVRDEWGFNPENQFFASRGYIVLQVNYRGSSGYGAAFQNAGLRARFDTVIIDDIADGARFLIDQKEVDPARVAVMGGSFGGWATYMSLIKYPELYRAGIATSAISNWRKFLRDDKWEFNNKLASTFWESLLNRENFAADEKFIDPYLRAAEIKQPLFIIHGERDTTVSSVEAKLMLDAVTKQNPNVQSRSFPRATHTYWPFEDRVVRLNEMALFLDKYLAKPVAQNLVSSSPELSRANVSQ